jgi:endonuclease-3 related protein
MSGKSTIRENRVFRAVYELLRDVYGPQRWWPVTPRGEKTPRYTGGPRSDAQRFEVAVGAILTQNTAWTNASRAIEILNADGIVSPETICALDEVTLAGKIRCAGYYNQKARRLRTLAAFFRSGTPITREALLALEGVGPETADSIMLYAVGSPHFVVDRYTRRMFGRLGLVRPDDPYEEVRRAFERALPRRVSVYREYHALIVEHGKRLCRKSPLCEKCLLKKAYCLYAVRGEKRGSPRVGSRDARRS